jgi:hypothetical protein
MVCLELQDAIELRNPFLFVLAYIICKLGYGSNSSKAQATTTNH